jgi:hypothetical protein
MVDLAEIQAAYYMVAATGVLVAAVFYILNLRMVQKKMKLDATMIYGALITNKDQVPEWRHLLYDTDFTSWEDWDKRYRTNPKEYENIFIVAGAINQLGVMVKEKVVDPELLLTIISPIWVKGVWAKISPMVYGYRTAYHDPSFYKYAEFLYNETERMYPGVKVPAGRHWPIKTDKTP